MTGGKPWLVVVGAPKAGTTTLLHHLHCYPNLFAPLEAKELPVIGGDRQSRDLAQRRFAQTYAATPSSAAARVFVSTRLTLASVTQEEVEELRTLLQPDPVWIVFSLRDRLERCLSDYSHAVKQGRVDGTVSEVTQPSSSFVEGSIYSDRLRPFVEVFGAERMRILDFASYSDHPANTMTALLKSVGMLPEPEAKVDPPQTAHNVTASSRFASGVLGSVVRSDLYSVVGRALIPRPLRSFGKRILLRESPMPNAELSPEREQELKSLFAADAKRLDGMAIQMVTASA